MGMYTELIFGASLKEDTPNSVISALKFMSSEMQERPADFPLNDWRCEVLFLLSSNYFGVNKPLCRMWFDEINKQWHISVRSNIKNEGGTIECFLSWISQYIAEGSGALGLYAITIHENQEHPTLYYLKDSNR